MDTENIVVDPEMLNTDEVEQTAPETPDKPEPRVPDKFQGKSLEEIVSAYSELESELGRKGNEVGQLRRLTDQLLGLEQSKKAAGADKPAARQKITSDQLFDDPDTTIAEIAKREANERVAHSEAKLNYLEQSLYEEKFDQIHKGFRETMQRPDFIDFVKNSRYRQGLVARAAQNDWDAADELFVAWEERQAEAPAAASNVAKARSATLAKSGGSSAAGVVPRNDGKKTYSRAELIEMRVRDPDGFDARFQSEYLPAYMEGRVK